MKIDNRLAIGIIVISSLVICIGIKNQREADLEALETQTEEQLTRTIHEATGIK